jgi:hypothetical protein
VVIDRSGTWWRGDDPRDLHDYLVAFTAEGHPADEIRDCVCSRCGGRVFGLRGDGTEGCGRRNCRRCGRKEYIADSAEIWSEARPRTCSCPCGSKDFNLAVAFALRSTGDVRWVTVGERCVRCGVLGSFVDWSIDYGDNVHLLDLV